MKPVPAASALFALLFAVNAPSSPSDVSEQVHRLRAGDFEVEIATDTRRLEPQFGPRFDRSAVVTSVRRGGVEFLEPRGLCDEFGLRGMGVLGYAEATVGSGEFLKIGVGVLRRDAPGDYSFIRHWPVVESLPVTVTAGETELVATQRGPLRHGYAYELNKRYRITSDGTLVLELHLKNLGEKSFAFEHYNHNFLSLGAPSIGPSIRVSPAFALPEPGNEHWLVEDGTLRLARPAPGRGGVIFGVELRATVSENRVRLARDGGPAVEIEGDFAPARFAVWATAAAICPEIFFRSEIAPGASVRWSHTYRFRR